MKYNKDLITKFLNSCKQGLTPTQIASDWGILVEELQAWSTDSKYKKTWQLGKEAFQAYHETLLARMTDKTREDYLNVSNSELSAQQYRLKVLFKDQWSEKSEPQTVVTNNHFANMSNEEVDKHLKAQLTKLAKQKPDLQIESMINKDLH